ncbi:class I SAM-dependent methyltransferase [Candidatus Gottesmanbacteria bacterium]|nr:class I SAM-dependent methyltransferase [Candidatus Gottesmanbacteria bacterium]
MNSGDINSLKHDIRIDATLRNFPMTFYSTWGLFSPKSIDEGTTLLINSVDVRASDTILDIGCGYGSIGLSLAKLAPQGNVHLIDKDYVAVEYTKKNAHINHINNVEAYLSNGFSAVPNVQFDCIVSNLPAKVGKELMQILIYEAREHLKPNGKLYVVTISGLREFIKRTFKECFGNYEKSAQNGTYTVSLAYKR